MEPGSPSRTAWAAAAHRALRVTEIGGPWVTYFDPAALADRLKSVGLPHIEDLGTRELLARYFRGMTGAPPERGGHVAHARN
jgi:O-methyltransferase involved in polyketide biosynthesis